MRVVPWKPRHGFHDVPAYSVLRACPGLAACLCNLTSRPPHFYCGSAALLHVALLYEFVADREYLWGSPVCGCSGIRIEKSLRLSDSYTGY